MLLFAIALAGTAPPDLTSGDVASLVSLYDRLCLQAFPDDEAIGKAVEAEGGVRLADVRQYLHDDPGIGWALTDGRGQTIVTVEKPPYHACAVRRSLPVETVDLAPFDRAVASFQKTHGKLEKMPPVAFEVNGQHSIGTAWARTLPDGGGDMHMRFENRPIARGPNIPLLEIRFVHQQAAPPR